MKTIYRRTETEYFEGETDEHGEPEKEVYVSLSYRAEEPSKEVQTEPVHLGNVTEEELLNFLESEAEGSNHHRLLKAYDPLFQILKTALNKMTGRIGDFGEGEGNGWEDTAMPMGVLPRYVLFEIARHGGLMGLGDSYPKGE